MVGTGLSTCRLKRPKEKLEIPEGLAGTMILGVMDHPLGLDEDSAFSKLFVTSCDLM